MDTDKPGTNRTPTPPISPKCSPPRRHGSKSSLKASYSRCPFGNSPLSISLRRFPSREYW